MQSNPAVLNQVLSWTDHWREGRADAEPQNQTHRASPDGHRMGGKYSRCLWCPIAILLQKQQIIYAWWFFRLFLFSFLIYRHDYISNPASSSLCDLQTYLAFVQPCFCCLQLNWKSHARWIPPLNPVMTMILVIMKSPRHQTAPVWVQKNCGHSLSQGHQVLHREVTAWLHCSYGPGFQNDVYEEQI